MLPLFRLRTPLLFIPFALNYELAAREEFCRGRGAASSPRRLRQRGGSTGAW